MSPSTVSDYGITPLIPKPTVISTLNVKCLCWVEGDDGGYAANSCRSICGVVALHTEISEIALNPDSVVSAPRYL